GGGETLLRRRLTQLPPSPVGCGSAYGSTSAFGAAFSIIFAPGSVTPSTGCATGSIGWSVSCVICPGGFVKPPPACGTASETRSARRLTGLSIDGIRSVLQFLLLISRASAESAEKHSRCPRSPPWRRAESCL